jgi:hypothetical protein
MPESSEMKYSADFVHRYANQVTFELNSSDLRIVFGITEKNAPVFHTAITVTWAEAKLLHHFLSQNIKSYEFFEGKIRIPAGMMPPSPPEPREDRKDDSTAQTIYRKMVKLHEALLADQKLDGKAPQS